MKEQQKNQEDPVSKLQVNGYLVKFISFVFNYNLMYCVYL